jgi:hypothetical protein
MRSPMDMHFIVDDPPADTASHPAMTGWEAVVFELMDESEVPMRE